MFEVVFSNEYDEDKKRELIIATMGGEEIARFGDDHNALVAYHLYIKECLQYGHKVIFD